MSTDPHAPPSLLPGMIVWVDFDPIRGREQSDDRLALVVSSIDSLNLAIAPVSVIPITTTDRGWPNHVAVGDALERPSWIMTEQIRTISRDRITRVGALLSAECFTTTRQWVTDFLDLGHRH